MKRVFLLLLIVCLAGAGVFYYASSQANSFTGSYTGPMKVPGIGWTAARIKITRADKDFEISGTAGRYKRLPTEREWRLALAQERIKHPQPPKSASGKINLPLPPKPPVFSRPYPAPATYHWVEDLGATYQGKMVGRDLVLDAQMGFVFTAGKVRGTLTMPDGTVFKADTPENYQAIKDELREKLLQQEPGAIILKETAEK